MATMSCASRNAGIDNSFSATSKAYKTVNIVLKISKIKPVARYGSLSFVRKPDFCLGKNKGADQLRGNREADQRLCFRYSDSTIPLLLKSEISSF